MKSSASKFRLPLLALLLCSLPLYAQNSGFIQGVVVDPAGAVIPGASVEATDQAKGNVALVTKSGADGLFVLQPLQPGTYTITVRTQGMKEIQKKNIHLDPYQKLDLGSVTTEVGGTNEVISVEAQTPLVETATADHSAVIDSKLVTETSLNGRDFQSLVRTLPGVVSNDPNDFRLAFNNTNAFHVNGLRGSDNNFFLDGAVNTDVGANDGQYTQLSMDAVGEFKIQSNNFAAEYGRNPGVLLAVNTKSGGRQFHGTLYEFNRQDGFDAAPFGSAGVKNYVRFNQYGGNIGGPIPLPGAKNKLFFFFNYEGTRGITPGNTQFNHGTFAGLGFGYEVPNPAVLNITPAGLDLTSQYTGVCDPASRNNCAGLTNFNAGQVFVPGSTHYTGGQLDSGTPICGTSPADACNIIPASFLSSQAGAFAKYFGNAFLPGAVPDPSTVNAATNGQAQKFFVPFNERYNFRKHQEVIRIDYNVNAKTNFFFRWVDDSQQEQYHNLFDFADYPILPEFRKKPGSSWSWNLVNVITPTMTNEFIFSYNHLTQVVDIVPGTSKALFDRTALGFTFQELYPLSNLDNRAPVLNNCCNGTFTGGSFHPGWHSEARQFTWTDNLTKVFGAHTFKTGVFFDYNQAGQQPVWQDTTFIDFSTGATNPHDTGSYLGNVFMGYYNQVQQSNGVFFGGFRFHQVEAYGQDTWRVNRKLTLDYGLRWAYLGPTYTVQPFFQNYFDPGRYNSADAVTLNTTPGNYFGAICSAALQAIAGNCVGVTNFGDPFNGIVQEGHGIPPGFADHRYANLAPRFGFAYDPFGDGKTAIRAGAGIFYERIRQNVNSFDGLGNPPLSYTPTIFGQRVDDLNPGLVTGIRSPVNLNAFDKRGQIPTTYGYSFGVQRELPGQMGVEATYTGNVARHLQYQYNLQATPVGSFTTAPSGGLPFVAAFKGYNLINFTKYAANSSYNALQLKLTRRFSRGLTMTADYTWSKSLDIADSDNPGSDPNVPGGSQGGNLTDPFHPRLDWAAAGWDRRNVFNVNYVYTLPDFHATGAMRYLLGGWQVSGITRFWSGTPINVYMGGSDYNGNAGNFVGGSSSGFARPDLSGGPVYLSKSDHVHWLNPGAFVSPAIGSIGDIRRNAFRGPGINNWDVSLFKNINFTERTYLQLRLESFNTFNHTQPATINSNFTATGPSQPVELNNPSGAGNISGYRNPRNVQLGIKFYF